MDQSAKDMIYFCMEFVRNNVYEQSQNVQCRTWLKMAIDIIEQNALEGGEFMVSNLKSADAFFSGVDGTLTSNNVIEKVKMVELLLTNV